jgi:nitrate/TMAO reductase-like tetraheme cytochrome c subunit
MHSAIPISGVLALACSALASIILIVYLIKRPAFSLGIKLWLFFGLCLLPLGTALGGNAAGMEATKQVTFCNSCHVMNAHAADARDPNSQSLAARHTRNPLFGKESCYVCHADYGMMGTVFTKIGGMRHVYEYVTEYHDYSMEQFLSEIHLRQPMPNRNCQQCHSGTNKLWLGVPEHYSAQAELAAGRISCGSPGCHGFAHPFSKDRAPAPEAHMELLP